MEYRKLGRTGLDVSAVSLGTEYLIDLPRETVVAVIREAIAQGVNYFDLFFAQPEFRDNMGAAFEGFRDRVLLAAHLGATERDGQADKTRDAETAERFFADFLARYETDHVDVLFLHNSDGREDYEMVMRPGGLGDLAESLRGRGKARFVGFSGHTVSTALRAVESGRVDVLMFPVSLAGNAVEGKNELLGACASNEVGLVAMKPFAGGRLLQRDREVVADSWLLGSGSRRLTKSLPITPAACLSYVLSQVGVSTVVPGCKDLEELAASLAYLGASEEERDFSEVVKDFDYYVTGECVYCNHCLPCPADIDIARTMRLLDSAGRQPTAGVRAEYAALDADAADCIQCGACVERCPFEVDVIAGMETALKVFS